MRWLMNGMLVAACCLFVAGADLMAQQGTGAGGGAGGGAGAGTGAGAGSGAGGQGAGGQGAGGQGVGQGAGGQGAGGQAGTGRGDLIGGQTGAAGQTGGGALGTRGQAGLGTNAGARAGLGAQADGFAPVGTPPGNVNDGQDLRTLLARAPIMIALDVDGNGVISAPEVQNAPMALARLDRNGDAVLSIDELLNDMSVASRAGLSAAVANPGAVLDPAQMAAQFMAADKNNDGFIDKTETLPRTQQMFARADLDRDGRLSREEVTQLATVMSERRDNAAGRNEAAATNARNEAVNRTDAGARAGTTDRQAEDRERSIRARSQQ